MFAAIIASEILKRKNICFSVCSYGYQHLADRQKDFMETDPEVLSRTMTEINNKAIRRQEPELDTFNLYAKAS
ncbi:MAG: hypothetical protein R3C41_13085 [Calditrichia bacterium]